MPRKKANMHAVLGGSPDEVESAFYEALQHAELDRLMACWSEDEEVVCIHPGGSLLLGGVAIRAAFEVLFAQGTSIRVHVQQIRRLDTLTSAVHHVLERVDVHTQDGPASAYVLATNVYHKTPQGWRMVVHHASPGNAADASPEVLSQQVLH